MITIFSSARDEVIRSCVSIGQTDYRYVLDNLHPLLLKFDEQRKLQTRSFYSRLRKDIVNGCVMPPLTIAFVDDDISACSDPSRVQDFVNRNIAAGYVLDGMQRINTLLAAATEKGFQEGRVIPLNVIVTERYDFLLYRMVTLNNGQRPMTARHQIEMLTKGMVETEQLKNLEVRSEKDASVKAPSGRSLKGSDVAEAYTAFLSNSVNNSNSRIIQSKLDEILVGKVMDSGISELSFGFQDVLAEADRLSADPDALSWLRLGNNLIGFAVGIRNSYTNLVKVSPSDFGAACDRFESAFGSINASRVNVGKIRRELASDFVSNVSDYVSYDDDQIVERFFEVTAIE